MQGYQPAARRLAPLPDKPQHLADGGAVGFGARGLAGLRQMIPLVQAMGYPQQQAAAPAPAPALAADTRTAQLQAMIPRMEAMGYKQQPQQPQYLARGGMVRGPGTSTSDSIPDEAEPGTFIMPADSTQAIGPSALEKMGTVPVRLSDGEFKVPPEQVMAIGEAVLKLMKDATHAPVNGVDGGQTDEEVAEARGFVPGAAGRMAEMPEQLFADGGLIENDVTRVGNSYSGGNVGGAITVNGAAPGGTFSENPGARLTAAPAPAPATTTTVSMIRATPPAPAPAPAPAATPAAAPLAAAPAAAPMGWQARQDQRNAEVSAASITNRPEWNRAAGFQPRRYADGGMVEDDLQKRLAQIPTGGPAGWTGGGAPATQAPAPALSAMAAAPAPAPAAAPAPAGALSRAAAMTPPAPAPAVQALSAMPANPTGGQVSTQNMDAAESLARRGAADAMASMPNAPAPVQAPVVRHSGNDWQARNDLRNALVSASSITNNGGRFDQHKGESAESLTYRAMLGTDQALRGAQPGLDQSAMRENAENQRAGIQLAAASANSAADRAGALERTLITERGNNTRAGIGAQATIEAARTKADASGNKPLNDVQSKALQFGTRMQTAGAVLDGLAARGVDQPGLIKRAADAVGLGGAANWTQSGEQQQVEQAQRDFINAVLRRESGAAIADSEFANARQQYFPQVGDSPEVIAQKRKNREIATAGVLAEVPDSEKRVSQVLGAANNAPAAQGTSPAGAPVQVTDAASYQALPSGATYITPTGEVRRKK